MSPVLKTLITDFSQWQQKPNRGRVPHYLKQQVIELCEQYSPDQLAHYLSLKKSTVKQWQQRSKRVKKNAVTDALEFITLPTLKPAPTETETVLAGPSLSVELSHGIKLFLHGQNTQELVELAGDLVRRLMA
jgi:hypothetical protein